MNWNTACLKWILGSVLLAQESLLKGSASSRGNLRDRDSTAGPG